MSFSQLKRQIVDNAFEWNTDALDELMPQVYTELKRLAGHHLKNERTNHTLSPTAVVHEVYILLRAQHSIDLNDRVYFLSLASTMMRRVLVNYAKNRKRKKRGEGIPKVSIDSIKEITLVQFEDNQVDFIELENALNQLTKRNKRQERIVELRFFGGLKNEEIAELMGISERTVIRDWKFAKTWLYKKLKEEKFK